MDMIMGMLHHDHSHVPTVTDGNERKLISFFVIFGFMLVEALGGYISGSLALLADAGYADRRRCPGACLRRLLRFGRRAADKQRTFGYLRFEVIAGLVNALDAVWHCWLDCL